MLDQLQGHLTDEEVLAIRNVIIGKYIDYRRLVDGAHFRSVFAEEYAPHNRQFGVSWAIASAFPSQTTLSSFRVSRILYGKGHTRPCLSNDRIELMILNATTHFNADYLCDRYMYNAKCFSNEKLFAYIKFAVDHRKLTRISLCVPNEQGKVIAEEILLDRNAILTLAA